MSMSFYLYCAETKQCVHVAEASSRWFRGADFPDVVGAFCLAHQGKELRSVYSDDFDGRMEYDLWEAENVKEAYAALAGHPLDGL